MMPPPLPRREPKLAPSRPARPGLSVVPSPAFAAKPAPSRIMRVLCRLSETQVGRLVAIAEIIGSEKRGDPDKTRRMSTRERLALPILETGFDLIADVPPAVLPKRRPERRTGGGLRAAVMSLAVLGGLLVAGDSSGWFPSPWRDLLGLGSLAAPAAAVQAEKPVELPTYVVQAGDSMSLIAARVLGSQDAWRELLKANPALADDPDSLAVGTVLKLPAGLRHVVQ